VRWTDVSMPLFSGMPAFPGDPPFSAEPLERLDAGAMFGLSRITLGSHTGTHLDPPSHFVRGGMSIDRIDLGTLNGPCLVIEGGTDRRSVTVEELASISAGATRVLLRTPNSLRWERRLEYFEDYVGLSLPAALWLADHGVRLVGIDALSIEADGSEGYPVHRALLGRGVVILEGLLLGAVTPGAYELACWPLRIRDGDGGPARVAVGRADQSRSSGGSRSGMPSSIG